MNIATTPSNLAGFDPTALHDTLQEVRKIGTESINKALTLLTNVDAGGILAKGKDGVLELAPPKGNLSAMDLTLRIGLLQDALNQLQQAVSKNEIEGRLNDLNRENREKLDQMKDQMKHIEEEAKKKREADKKMNIFDAIAYFFKAIFDIISAVFTAIAAVAYAVAGNLVAAAGLFAAAVALAASGMINLVLSINSMVKAAGGSGMSDSAVKGLQKTTEILGYVAMGAAMASGLGMLIKGVQQGVNIAAGAMRKPVMDAVKDQVIKNMSNFMDMTARMSLAQGIGQGTQQIVTGSGRLAVADLNQQAAAERLKADQAEAAAKAIEAMIQMLKKMIEQLQEQLQEMLESCMDAVSAVFKAADETADSLKKLMQFQSA